MKDQLDRTDGYYLEAECDLADFAALTSRKTDPDQAPSASGIEKNVPIYDVEDLADTLSDPKSRRGLMAEWAAILHSGAGVLALQKAQPDHTAIDATTTLFEEIIAEEKAAGGSGADHFAATGSNDRIWNSLQKHCLKSPETFVRYYASPAMDAVAEAWLGPNYQLTAQVNLVHPGGKAQEAHRDYHMGFMTAEICETYPAHVHDLSPLMTLQGALAHIDVPVESGPTKLLPYSQLYRPGYAAYRRDDFRQHFEDHHVQLPLAKGDAVFFNPALFHAAGENKTSDVHRMVNLFQVGSAFGRAIESVDRLSMCKALYEPLREAMANGSIDAGQLKAVIASAAEGYSFPTNLDRDPPIGGLAPETQNALMSRAIASDMPSDAFFAALDAQQKRKEP